MENTIKAINACAVSSRVRLARNLFEYPFNTTSESDYANARIIDEVYRVVSSIKKVELIRMNELSLNQAMYFKDRYLISQALIENSETGAVLLDEDEKISIMINEEDHIREQCFERGFNLKKAYDELRLIDVKLCERLKMARDAELGFLTACLTNVGTGLRASVMLFLPALTRTGKMAKIIESVTEQGMTVRGVFGEGSKAEGCMYQLSNETTIGAVETEIIAEVEEATQTLCEIEYNERVELYEAMGLELEDECKRAYGIATNCALLSTDEFMRLMTSIKLGASLGIINLKDETSIDKLIVSVRPESLNYQGNLTAFERDEKRAKFVSETLKALQKF